MRRRARLWRRRHRHSTGETITQARVSSAWLALSLRRVQFTTDIDAGHAPAIIPELLALESQAVD